MWGKLSSCCILASRIKHSAHTHSFSIFSFLLWPFALPPTISVLSVCLCLPLIGNRVFAGGGVAILRGEEKKTVSHITSTLLPVF